MYKAWIQTTPYTCGPSSLMTALGELEGKILSHEWEIEIWQGSVPWSLRYIMAKLIGTPPCFLTKYIKLNIPCSELKFHIFPKNWSKIIVNESRIKYRIGVWIHDNIIVPFSCAESVQWHKDIELTDWVFNYLIQNSGRHLLTNIVMKTGVLHFILIRYDNQMDKFVVMDPWPYKNPYPEPFKYPYPYPDRDPSRYTGEMNNYYSIEEFKKEIGEYLFGYTISFTL
jgi:hypothetical protein